MDFSRRPMLVFWEATRACGLACRHCRAEAVPAPLPGQLSTAEALDLVDQVASFGAPNPVLIATGGDVLMREDLEEVAARAAERKVPLALAPSVTPLLDGARVAWMRRIGVKIASISLDGALAATHDGVRGIPGHFEATLDAIRLLREHRISVQVNTTVMRDNVDELHTVAQLVGELDAAVWEVFFLVRVGRGTALRELDPEENEEVCNFLYDASRKGFVVRTVEAPFFRRVVAERGRTPGLRAQTKGTRDGSGLVFVAHDGAILPSGFLPLPLGNVRRDALADVYRDHPLLQRIRAAEFSGRCGSCAFRETCGGSRARAYATSGDPLGEDPACPF